MKKILIIIFVIFHSFSASAQGSSKIINYDTIKIVQTKVFDYIKSTIDSISLQNFIPIQEGLSNTIYYKNTDTSESYYRNLFQNSGFKYVLQQKTNNIPVKINATERKLFFKEIKFASARKAYYYLLISPLVRFNNKIYCHLYVKSANTSGTIYMGEMNFIFNELLEIIKATYVDSIID